MVLAGRAGVGGRGRGGGGGEGAGGRSPILGQALIFFKLKLSYLFLVFPCRGCGAGPGWPVLGLGEGGGGGEKEPNSTRPSQGNIILAPK